jgi:GntR family transcriptional regulator
MSEVGVIPSQGDADIRVASHRDAAGIAAVHVDSWLATYAHLPKTARGTRTGVAGRVALWTRRLTSPETGCSTLVATTDGRIRGFVYAGPTTDVDDDPSVTAQVFSIHVEPEFAGRGVGRGLMARAVASLHAAGYTVATLWVVAENRRARRFYERLGWRVDGATRRELLAVEGEDGDDVEVVRYRLDLGPEAVGRTMKITRPVELPARALPKYYELRQWLRQHIDGLPPGTPVRPERALSEQFNISRTTVRQALHDLAVEGRIVRMQGRGTFVATPKVTQRLQLTSYTEDMRAQGLRPGSHLIDVTVTEAEPDVADSLGLREGSPVTRVERVRYSNGEPMAVETVYLDHQRFPGIGERLSEAASLYALLEERFGVVPVEGEETVETVLAPPAASRLLGTDPSIPMLLLTRTSRDATGRPVEYVRSLYRGDRFRLSARLTRPSD